MGKTDPNQTAHFFITQTQTLLLGIFITGLMQLANHLSIYLIYCCPVLFFLMLLEYYLFWKPTNDLTYCFNIVNVTMFIIGSGIFFGIFFGIFHKTASLEFDRAQNCSVSGQMSDYIEQNEKYTILYINFEYKGQQYLGQACQSNQYQAGTAQAIVPYSFIYKGDTIPCGPETTQDQTTNRILQLNLRNLAVGGGGGSSGGGGGGSSGGGSSSSGTGGGYSDSSSDNSGGGEDL